MNWLQQILQKETKLPHWKNTCSVETFFKEIFLVFIVSFQTLNMRLIKKTQVLAENWNMRIENVQ